MRAAILRLLAEDGDPTFFELCRRVPGAAGTLALAAGGFPNVILWDGLSSEAIAALQELERDGKIYYKQTGVMIYQLECQMPDLPIAKGLCAYKRRRWLPALIRLKVPGKPR